MLTRPDFEMWWCSWCGRDLPDEHEFSRGTNPTLPYCSVGCKHDEQRDARKRRRQAAKAYFSKLGRLFGGSASP